ncbi:MAG: sialidase family protein [Balneolaceae bacterium]
MKLFTFLLTLILFAGCSQPESDQSDSQVLYTGPIPDLPQMKYLNSGDLIAWWTQKDPQTDKFLVAMARSEDHGRTFGKAAIISETSGVSAAHGESLPALVEKPDGTLVMVFSVKNEEAEFRFAGSVKYIQSFDNGKSWTKPEIVHKSDTNIENSHSFVAATLLADGEVGTVWLDGRHKLNHAVMYFSKTNGRKGFGEDYAIGEATCECCKNSMLTDNTGTLHISYRGLTDGTRDIMHFKSNDNGETFTKPAKVSDDGWKIDACPHNGPAMALGEKNDLHFIWYSLAGGEGLFYTTSSNFGDNFENRIQISDNPVAKHPQVEVFDNHVVVVWDELIGNGKEAHKRAVLSVIHNDEIVNSINLSTENQDGWAPNIIRLETGDLLTMWVEVLDGVQLLKYEVIDSQNLQKREILASF